MKSILFVLIFSSVFMACAVTRPPLIISANINGEEEVPPVESLAFGAFYGVVGQDQNNMHVRVTVSCIDNVTASHLHFAPRGQDGGVIVTLFSEGPVSDPQKRFALDLDISEANFEGDAVEWTFNQFLDQILAGNIYINVHTVAHPGGEARGQLEKFR